MFTKNYLEMDDTCIPYDEDKLPYKRTLEDDIFLVKMAEECGDTFEKGSYLAKLQEDLRKGLISL